MGENALDLPSQTSPSDEADRAMDDDRTERKAGDRDATEHLNTRLTKAYEHIEAPVSEMGNSQELADRMNASVELPAELTALATARDVIPNVDLAEIDRRKFAAYSLNPEHPQNGGKAEGWRALGYDVDDSSARSQAADDIAAVLSAGLLENGTVSKSGDSAYGTRHTVESGFIGPNGRHATLVTGWQVVDVGEQSRPRLVLQPHLLIG